MTRRASAMAAVWLWTCAPPPAAVAQEGSVIVMPFELERFDSRVAWLGEGASVGVSDALSRQGVAVVTRDERLAALERLQLPANSALARATMMKVAELVGASSVVLGRVGVVGSTVTLDVRVLDVESAHLGDHIRYLSPVATLLDAFARAAAAVRAPGRSTALVPAAPSRPSVVAFELYVRGLVGGREDVRERYLTHAVDSAPDYVEARLALWEVRTDRGADQLALSAVEPVRADTPFGFDARIRSAASLLRLRRYADAFVVLKALETSSRSAVVANLTGVVQLRRGWTPQTGRPAHYFNQAVERDVASADYSFNLGYAYWQDKDPMAAAYWLREAVRRNPADGDAHFVLAAALSSTGAKAEGERERELAGRLSARWEAAAGGDEVPRGLERVIDRAAAGRTRVDAVLTASAQQDHRELAAFHIDAARRAFDAGRDQEAIRELRRALYLTPYDAQAHVLLGRTLARSGLLSEATSALKVAVWSAETSESLVALAEILLRQHDVAGARRAAERAAELDPADAEVSALLARVRALPDGGA